MTELQARKLAKQIFASFDERIVEATNGSVVPPSFVAGLIANEPGKDRYGNIVETATRFEPHVFASLKAVRSGTRRVTPGFARHRSPMRQMLPLELSRPVTARRRSWAGT